MSARLLNIYYEVDQKLEEREKETHNSVKKNFFMIVNIFDCFFFVQYLPERKV